MAKPGDVIAGRYKLLEEHGAGGMSTVWLASDASFDESLKNHLEKSGYQPGAAKKICAVKEIQKKYQDADNQEVLGTLVAEAKILTGLSHPMLPRIYDIVEEDDVLYEVMDFIQGKDLKKHLESMGRPFDEKDVVDIGLQLCDVLGYLHAQNPPIIYRDMKPGNVMLREDGSVCLIDFGIAKEYTGDQSDPTKVGGYTKGYAPPEQTASDRRTTPRTDIYSLGATLYHLVTGIHPDAEGYFRKIREVNPQLSEGLERIIAEATQQEPSKRYQSIKEMRWALENYQNLTKEYEDKQKAKIRRFVMLRNAAIALGVAGVLLLFAGFQVKSSTYESHMDDARTATNEEAAAWACFEAIETDSSNLEPYDYLLESVYVGEHETGSFSQDEYATWNKLRNDRIGDIKDLPGYADLCYRTGLYLYLYYEMPESSTSSSSGDDVARLKMAAPWFNDAITSYEAHKGDANSCTLDPSAYQRAKAYVAIADFHSSYDDETADSGASECWDAFHSALNSLYLESNEKQTWYAKLRLCNQITTTLSISKCITELVSSADLSKEDLTAFLGTEDQLTGKSDLDGEVTVALMLHSIEEDIPRDEDRESFDEVCAQYRLALEQISKSRAGESRAPVTSSGEASTSSEGGVA